MISSSTSLQEERERCSMITDELTKMEVKLREQMKTNESLRMQLAAEEDRYKVSIITSLEFKQFCAFKVIYTVKRVLKSCSLAQTWLRFQIIVKRLLLQSCHGHHC